MAARFSGRWRQSDSGRSQLELKLQYSSLPSESVLDVFGGSGSTLIAAQQTGRRAFLMELDPLYCDVIVQQYEQFTGQKAERRIPAQGTAA